MIRLDLVTTIAGVLFLSLMFFFIAWFAGRRRMKKDSADLQHSVYLQQCSYCGQVFMDYTKSAIIKCPTCDCYLEEKGETSYAQKQE